MRQQLIRLAFHVAVAFRPIGALIAQIGVQEVLFVGGVSLLAYGLSLLWMPAAFILPGSILTAVAVFGVR